MISEKRKEGGGALKGSGSSAPGDRGQLSSQLVSLAASLIGFKREGTGQVLETGGKSFQQ